MRPVVKPLAIKPLALSCGDPAGIGLEIALKAWIRRREDNVPAFFLLAEPEWVHDRINLFDLPVSFTVREDAFGWEGFDESLGIEPLQASLAGASLGGASDVKPVPGEPQSVHASGIIAAIERGVDHVMQGRASALVTCPIAKKPLYDAGFAFPGHTEFLAHLAEISTGKQVKPVMMLAGGGLRTVPVTIHIALAEVAQKLDRDLIIETALVVAADLRDKFGLAQPRLAIAGLNPHAGEGGAMGKEDENVVRPAVQYLQQRGLNVIGPLPADTMFHEAARKNYDVALCMYHDQALIPVKTLGFETGVNVTLGLPFIRTSPDHGTAFDIAAQGIATPDSLIAALQMAAEMAENTKKGNHGS